MYMHIMKVLVLGHKGWLGNMFMKLLQEQKIEYVTTEVRADDARLCECLKSLAPTHVVSFIGRTHGEGYQTIDYLELPGKLHENVRDNLYAPVNIALVCQKMKIHYTYIGTGCIFDTDEPESTSYDEDDEPDFFGSNYSIVKGFTDRLMRSLCVGGGGDGNVLNVRIRMPIANEDHPRNFISKIIRYKNVCSVPNSMSVVTTLFPCMLDLMKQRHVGTVNLVNPGIISHDEVLHMYKEIVDPDFTWTTFSVSDQNTVLLAKRSNNQLSTRSLQTLCPYVPDIRTAVRMCLESWEAKLNGHDCVLITGGCGAIGGEVVNYMIRRYNKTHFVNVDALTYCGKRENIDESHPNYTFVNGNICDIDCIMETLETYQPTLLIHFAAETHVDQSFGDSLKFTHTNIVGTHVLLEAVRKYKKLKLFLHMSTDEVYGSVEDDAICTETAMFFPSNPYAASKAGAEMLCHSYIKSFNLPIIIMRCNNAISKYQHPEKLVPKCIDSILKGEKIPIHGVGESKRTFIHGVDIARAICVIAEKGIVTEIYNIGTQMEYTVCEVVKTVLDIMKPVGYEDVTNWIEHVPDRNFQDYRYCIDTSKLLSLGWEPKVSFEDAIKDVVSYKTKAICC